MSWTPFDRASRQAVRTRSAVPVVPVRRPNQFDPTRAPGSWYAWGPLGWTGTHWVGLGLKEVQTNGTPPAAPGSGLPGSRLRKGCGSSSSASFLSRKLGRFSPKRTNMERVETCQPLLCNQFTRPPESSCFFALYGEFVSCCFHLQASWVRGFLAGSITL